MQCTYTKLRDGDWGIRADEPLIPGQTVTVTKRDGGTKTETVARVVWSGQGTTLATIKATIKSSPQASRRTAGSSQHKTCWECGRVFTRAEMFDDGDWAESYCGC